MVILDSQRFALDGDLNHHLFHLKGNFTRWCRLSRCWGLSRILLFFFSVEISCGFHASGSEHILQHVSIGEEITEALNEIKAKPENTIKGFDFRL